MGVHRFVTVIALAAAVFVARATIHAQGVPVPSPQAGILLLAHGGSGHWNAHVADLAQGVDREMPVEVALGMASRPSIQAAVDRLVNRGVSSVVAVPLFVSSWSSVITATEYLLGQRSVAPADLELFARMDHGSHGIEQGIRNRLDGLSYTMATQALIPDVRIQEWVLEQARQAGSVPLR
jgi:hypothetical protein